MGKNKRFSRTSRRKTRTGDSIFFDIFGLGYFFAIDDNYLMYYIINTYIYRIFI